MIKGSRVAETITVDSTASREIYLACDRVEEQQLWLAKFQDLE